MGGEGHSSLHLSGYSAGETGEGRRGRECFVLKAWQDLEAQWVGEVWDKGRVTSQEGTLPPGH